MRQSNYFPLKQNQIKLQNKSPRNSSLEGSKWQFWMLWIDHPFFIFPLRCYSASMTMCNVYNSVVWLPISVGALDFEYAGSACQLNGNNFFVWGST